MEQIFRSVNTAYIYQEQGYIFRLQNYIHPQA
jgi:hypothetical protein